MMMTKCNTAAVAAAAAYDGDDIGGCDAAQLSNPALPLPVPLALPLPPPPPRRWRSMAPSPPLSSCASSWTTVAGTTEPTYTSGRSWTYRWVGKGVQCVHLCVHVCMCAGACM